MRKRWTTGMLLAEQQFRRIIGYRDPAKLVIANNLVMLIGPAANGALLEIGVLDIDGDDPGVIHADANRRARVEALRRALVDATPERA
jgi:hypothetical protein